MTPTAPATTGMTVLDLAQAGRFEEIHDLFAPPLRAMVPAEALQAAWAAEIAQRGPVTAVGEPVSEPADPGGVVVKIPASSWRAPARPSRPGRGSHRTTRTRRRSTGRT